MDLPLSFTFNSFRDVVQRRADELQDKIVYRFIEFKPDESRAEQVISYKELERKIRSRAAMLQDLNAYQERALLLYPPGIDFNISTFACFYAGVIAVPSYPPISALFIARIIEIINNAKAKFILCPAFIRDYLLSVSDAEEFRRVQWVLTDIDEPDYSAQYEYINLKQDMTAFLQYTSGSTSSPKGVMVSHKNILHNEACIYTFATASEREGDLRDDTRGVFWLPVYHDMGLIGCVFQTVYAAGEAIFFSPFDFLLKPLRWLQLISETKAKVSPGPNFAFNLCTQKITEEEIKTLDLSSWRLAINGAEPIDPDVLARFSAKFAPCGFDAKAFHPCYGLAESTLLVSRRHNIDVSYDTKFFHNEAMLSRRIAVSHQADPECKAMVGCGQAVDETEIVIVNPSTRTLAAKDEIGEIWLSSPSVSTGYWDNPQATRDTFQAYLADSGKGPYLRTGDLGFLIEEDLYIAGRLKDLIIIRGQNYYPQDIEQSIDTCHPALRPGCVAAFSIDVDGQERLVITQEIARKHLESFNHEEVIRAITKAVTDNHDLGVYAVALIKPNSISKTSSGKIQRQLNKARYLDGTHKIVAQWSQAGGAAQEAQPAGPALDFNAFVKKRAEDALVQSVAEYLKEIIAPKLGVASNRISSDDPINKLGLDSLHIMEFMAKLESETGLKVSFADIMRGKTIFDLATGIMHQRQVQENIQTAAPAASKPDAVTALPIVKQTQTHLEYPVSLGQKALWLINELDPRSCDYNIGFAARIATEIDIPSLRGALQDLLDRHEGLRAHFVINEQDVLQCIPPKQEPVFDLIDATGCDSAGLENMVAGHHRGVFDLKTGPVFRAALFSCSNGSHVLLISLHHIIGDGWSMWLMLDELKELYLARYHSRPAVLGPVRHSFAEFVWQEQKFLESPELEKQAAYWAVQLDNPSSLALSIAKPNPFSQNRKGAMHAFVFDPQLAQGIRTQAKAHGVTVFVFLLAAYQTLLHRYSAQDDIIVGTPFHGRDNPDYAGIVGYFINMLAIRTDFSGGPAFRDLLLQVRDTLGAAIDHKDYPFAMLVDLLKLDRETKQSPVFQATFVLQTPQSSQDLTGIISGSGSWAWDDLVLEPFLLPQSEGQFDLSLEMVNAKDRISGLIKYNPDLFDAASIARMEEHFTVLLQAIVQSPRESISKLPLASRAERERLLVKYNATQARYPKDLCMHELFEAQARRAPDAVALEYAGAGMSYGELNARSNRLAHYLRSAGVGPDTLVVICAGRCHAMLEGVLGVLKAGGAYVPLDPAYPFERMEYMVKDSAPVAILTARVSKDVRELLADAAGPAVVVDLEDDAGQWDAQSAENIDASAIGLTPRNLAYVIYTSGSTGMPKGVMVEHAGIANMVEVQRTVLGIGPQSRMLQFASFSFDASVFEIFVTFYQGARLCLLPGDEMIGSKLAESINRAGITHCLIPPAALMSLPEDARFTTVQTLVVGGEASTRSVVRRWARDCRLLNAYGPTEITVFATLYECSPEDETDPPIGRAIANARVYILDKHMQPVPEGVAGEIYIGGVGVARGYWRRPELTTERFVPDPYFSEPGARMYKTGDMGRWLPDGNIEFQGRNDFQVKLRGFRIELGEIEARLMEHPAVGEAVVEARVDHGGEKRLIAYYTLSGGEDLGAQELRAYLQKLLPAYMVPAAYVELEFLPLTPNGKLDRGALPEPEGAAYVSRVYEEPVGEIEQALAKIWEEILQAGRIGRKDHFFELGGHSLLAVKLVSQIRQDMGLEVSLAEVFSKPVLADLAQAVRGATDAKLPPITTVDRDQDLELSYSQQRLWFLAQMQGVSRAYNMPMALHLNGDLDRQALLRAFDQMIMRHESLRTSFILDGDRPVQRIAPDASGFSLLEHDLSGQTDAGEKLSALRAEEAVREFDLEKGTLIRGRLVKMGAHEHVLLLTMHHIICDGWSMVVLAKDLTSLYRANHEGGPSDLEPLKIQYADYAAWQRGWLADDELRSQGEYWLAALSGAPDVLELPTDRPRPAQQDTAGGFVEIAFDEQLADGLRELARLHGVTLYMVVMAGFAACLAKLSNQNDIVIGTPVANRRSAELEELVGFFVNSLALRIDLSGSPTVAELLERVKQRSLAAQQHQDLPFEQVVEIVKPVRSLSHSPIFQVMFAWDTYELGELNLPGLNVIVEDQGQRLAKFDLSLALSDADGRISGALEYAEALFDRQTIERYAGYLDRMLSAMAANASQTLEQIDIMSEEQRRRILVEYNATQAGFPRDVCIHELFERQAGSNPQNIAVVYEGTELSYGELNERANRLAHYLRTLGAGPDKLVAICAGRCHAMMVGVLAVLKAGAAYVPLDPAYPPDRLEYMVKDSNPVAVLTAQVSDNVRSLLSAAGPATVLDIEADADKWAGLSPDNPGRAATGLSTRHLAYVIYTSGSTGMPKGVMVEHEGIANLVEAQREILKITSGSRVLQFASFSFDASVFEFFVTFYQGARLYMLPRSQMIGSALADGINNWEITHLTISPSALMALPEDASLNTVRTLLVAGEAASRSLVQRWGKGRLLINGYGPTESTVWSTYYVCRQEDTVDPPIGRPIPNTRIYLLDSNMRPVPEGVAGEIYIGSVGLARGYLNRPELTAERFVADPFSTVPGARLYKTGDVGRYLPDADIAYLGRNDFQVKLRGFRIELGEIEARLMEYPGVREAVVESWQDAAGEKRLAAYYIPADSDGSVDAGQLKSHLQESLPDYMVPAAYVQLAELPLTPNGKLDRGALPQPDASSYISRVYEEPQGEIEKGLALIWSEVLQVERVGRNDNFFELGGHSLLAVKLVNRMREQGLHADVRDLFTAPSLEVLASMIQDGAARVAVPDNLIPDLDLADAALDTNEVTI